jgi:RND family efflux transporter MFP subunit
MASLSTRNVLIVLLLVGMGIALTAIFMGRQSADIDTVTTTDPQEVVFVVHPNRKGLTRTITLPGSIRPYQEADVYAKVSGYLKDIAVDRGDWVKGGQPLAKLVIPEMDREYHRAESNMTMKERIYQRLESIRRQNPDLLPLEEVEQAQTDFEMARATRDELTALMAYATIRAPFDGVITTRYVHPGALIQAGTTSQSQSTPLVSIMDLQQVRITVAVSESEVAWITHDTPVRIEVAAWKGKELTGTVTRYATALDPGTRTMPTEILVKNADHALYPGMYASVTLTLEVLHDRLTLPRHVVQESGKGPQVLVVDKEGLVKTVTIQTGYKDARIVEVTDGLTGNEQVIVEGQQRVRPGDRVTVRKAVR